MRCTLSQAPVPGRVGRYRVRESGRHTPLAGTGANQRTDSAAEVGAAVVVTPGSDLETGAPEFVFASPRDRRIADLSGCWTEGLFSPAIAWVLRSLGSISPMS
jgi:hypothetical protein